MAGTTGSYIYTETPRNQAVVRCTECAAPAVVVSPERLCSACALEKMRARQARKIPR